MSQVTFDESFVGQLEALYRTRDVLRRRELVQEALGVRPGERVLDAGCGPGFFVPELLTQVGKDGSVVGVDVSADMLAVAARRCEGAPHVELLEADVTALPLEDATFDRAVCVQVLEYVQDTPRALSELYRVLRPSGRLVVWDVDWSTLSWHSSDVERMDRVLRAWDDHLTHPSLPRVLGPVLRAAGFDDVRVEGHAFATTGADPEAYGVSLLPAVERYVAGHDGIGEALAKEWADDQRQLYESGAFSFACIQFSVTGDRPAG